MDKPYDWQKQKYTHKGYHGISYKTAQVIGTRLDFTHSPTSFLSASL